MYIKSTNSQNINLSLTIYNNIALINESRFLPNPTPDSNPDINIEYFNISKFINEASVMVAGIDDFMMTFNYICCYNENNNQNSCNDCSTLIPESILIKASNVKSNEIKTSYLTSNVNWSGSYTIIFEEETLEIHSWFNLINKSGLDYNDISLKIVAGDINLPYKQLYISNVTNELPHFSLESSSTYKSGIIDYYIYTLPNKYTLQNNTIKRIKNFYKSAITYNRVYDFGYDSINANITINFLNTSENNLGFPLPSGSINTYIQANGNYEFVGGSSINDIAKNREVSFVIGNSFDVTCQRNIINVQKYQNYILKQIQYVIINTKKEAVFIKICEPIFAAWQMDSSSDKYSIDANNNPCFFTTMESNSRKEISFNYKYNSQST